MKDPARRRRIDEICDAALDREAGDRKAFVVTACEGDEALRQEVEALLAHAQTAERFLAVPVSAVAAEMLDETPTPVLGPVDLPPLTWGHFALLEQIGAGGFGEVYRAIDTKLDREVALKLLPGPSANGVRLAPHVLKEARLLARLRHPHVVTVYGADAIADRVGIWMELIRGQTLEDMVRTQGPFGARQAALIGVDLCAAVAAVHGAGLLHGDVKAQNVMREAGGRTVLMDFGAGSDLRPEVRPPAQILVGTAMCLAPETLAGESRTRATDIYSLGVLLYYLVSGAYPVEGSTFSEVIEAHRRGTRRRLRDVRDGVPYAFARIVEQAIAPDPEVRMASARLLQEELTGFLTGARERGAANDALNAAERAQRTAHLGLRPTAYFVGRDDDLRKVYDRLHGAGVIGLSVGQVVAITALGGTGKTTLARMFAERYWGDYLQLLWIDARRGYESELARLCDVVLPDIAPYLRELPDRDKARRVLSELDNLTGPRLLVIDDAEDEASVTAWLPKTGHVQTLITSRYAHWEAIPSYPLAVLDEKAARELLLARSERVDVKTTSSAEIAACNELAQRLGYLPLALEQAAAYIRKQHAEFGFQSYLHLFNDAQKELLSVRVRGTTDYPASVFATWRTTIDKLPSGARVMLRTAAFLAPTEIPLGIFRDSATELSSLEAERPNSEPNDATMTTDFRVRTWCQALAEYSLITLTPGDTFTMHPLLQAVERNQLDLAARAQWIRIATNAFTKHAPPPDLEQWPRWRLLSAHAVTLCSRGREIAPPYVNTAIIRSLCIFYAEQGRFADALGWGHQAIAQDEATLGPTHPETLSSAYSVAVALALQGETDDAERLFRQVLTERQTLLGPNALDTIRALQWLGNTLSVKGNQAAAEPLQQRALEGFERLLDPDSHYIHWSRWWLGRSCADLNAGEQLLRRVVAAQDRLRGPDHFLTLHFAAGLAHCLARQGKLGEAEGLARRAAAGLERIVGPDHRWTLQATHTLAHCMSHRGDSPSAE